MIKFTPTKGRVLVEPIVPKETTVGGIVVPANATDKPTEGVVVALPQNNKVEVKIGDRVIFNRFTGIDVKIGKALCKMLEPKELLAIID